MNTDAQVMKLRQVFADILGCDVDDVVSTLSPDTCEQWDSLAHVKIIIAIEEEFEIVITPEEQFDFDNYGQFQKRIVSEG